MVRKGIIILILISVILYLVASIINTALRVKVSYSYEFEDSSNVPKTDAVELNIIDTIQIELIMKWGIIESMERGRGYSSNYGLAVRKEGSLSSYLIEYPRTGRIRNVNTDIDYRLVGFAKDRFFSILDKYHRYQHVYLAG